MAKVEVRFFQEEDESVPLVEWIAGLVPKAQDKCLAKLARLEELGHELRRPEADYLGDALYELRVKYLGVNYRMLYFFSGRTAVVLSHGFSKQKAKVPKQELKEALRRKAEYESAPKKHTFQPEK